MWDEGHMKRLIEEKVVSYHEEPPPEDILRVKKPRRRGGGTEAARRLPKRLQKLSGTGVHGSNRRQINNGEFDPCPKHKDYRQQRAKERKRLKSARKISQEARKRHQRAYARARRACNGGNASRS